MARPIDAATLAEFESSTVRLGIFVEMLFDSGPLRLWNGFRDFTVFGDIYTGAGFLGRLSAITETTETRAVGLEFSLSGLPTSVLAISLNEEFSERPINIFLGAFDADEVLVADPHKFFSGRMDASNTIESGSTATITVTAESSMIDLRRAKNLRYTDQTQKDLFPGDSGLSIIADLQDREIVWGQRG